MNTFLRRFLFEYGMVVILVLLCAFFSVVTWSEQPATSDAAARQLGREIVARFGKDARVLLAVQDQAKETAFLRALERQLVSLGVHPVESISGEPKDARRVLQRQVAAGGKLDVVAGSDAAMSWLVFGEMGKDFPSLGSPHLVAARRYMWPNFLKSDNLRNIASQIAVIAIIAIGMTMVIIVGGIDLSVGSLVAVSAVLAALLIRDLAGGVTATPLAMIGCCTAAILTCALVGMFSGSMVTWFGVPPFIATLAIMSVGNGLAFKISKGESVGNLPDSFVWLGSGANFLGIPNSVVLMLFLYSAGHILMSRMKIGRYLYAVGGNREAARLSGVPVMPVLIFAYTVSGLLAGLGGVILASELKAGGPTYGQTYELQVISAVVIGGTSLSGGEGKMFRTLIGAFIMGVIKNGMNLTNVEANTQKIVLGLVILAAVLLDQLKHRGWGRRVPSES